MILVVIVAAGISSYDTRRSASAATNLPVVEIPAPVHQPGSRFANSISIGNIDGDSEGEIAIGSPSFDIAPEDDKGQAYVYESPPVQLLNSVTSPNPSPETSYGFGISIAAGDVNRDGLADFAVGEYGMVFVIDGGSGAPLLSIPSPSGADGFGLAVAMGDASGDGRADILVGAHNTFFGFVPSVGRAYLFDGHTGSLTHTFDSTSPLNQGGQNFGWSVAMGDVDGDLKSDVLVGEPYNYGKVYIFEGSSGSLMREIANPGDPNSQLGLSVAAGDLNGDAQADVLAGAPSAFVASVPRQGRAFAFDGGSGALLHTLDIPDAPSSDASFGFSLAIADMDNDGNGDIAVGAPGFDGIGRAYVFSGVSGSVLGSFDASDPSQDDRFGWTVALGDVGGDGKTDLVVGAPSWIGNEGTGRAFLFLTDPPGAPPTTTPRPPAVGGITTLVDDNDEPTERQYAGSDVTKRMVMLLGLGAIPIAGLAARRAVAPRGRRKN